MGHVIDERKARKSGCACYELETGKLMCYSQGVVGTLNEEQMPLFCTNEDLENPVNASVDLEGEQRRFAETVRRAESRYVEIPKDDRGIHAWGELLKEEFEASYGAKEPKKMRKVPRDVKVTERKKTEIEDVEETVVEEDYEFDVYSDRGYNYWELYGLVKFGEKQSGVPFRSKTGKRGTTEEFYDYIDEQLHHIFPEIEKEEELEAKEPEEVKITYEDLEKETVIDLRKYAKEENVVGYHLMKKPQLINALAEMMGLDIPIEKLDDDDLQSKAKLHGYRGRSKNRDILIEHIRRAELGETPEKEEPEPITKEPVEYYALVDVDSKEKQDWQKTIRESKMSWTALSGLTDAVPDDTSLLYRVRQRIEQAKVDKDMTAKGKSQLLKKVDRRIRAIEKKAKEMGADIDFVEMAEERVRKLSERPRKTLKPKDVAYAEYMDTIVKFKGSDTQLSRLEKDIETLEGHQITAKDKRQLLKLIKTEWDKREKHKDMKFKDLETRIDKFSGSADDLIALKLEVKGMRGDDIRTEDKEEALAFIQEKVEEFAEKDKDRFRKDVRRAEVTKKSKDVSEVVLEKMGTLKNIDAIRWAKAQAEEDYEEELNRRMQIKYIESGGQVVDVTPETREEMDDYRRDREDYYYNVIKENFILIKDAPKKADTDALFNTYLDRIEKAMDSKEALDEVEVSLDRFYLEGKAKDKLKHYLAQARKGRTLQEAEEVKEVEVEEKPALKPKDAKKVHAKIKKTTDIDELTKIGQELIEYQIDDAVQSLVTEIEKKKEALQAPSKADDDYEVAEPQPARAVTDSSERWDTGKVSDKVKVLAFLFEKEGVSRDGIVRWANLSWEELPKHVKKAVVDYRDETVKKAPAPTREVAPKKERPKIEEPAKEPVYKKVDLSGYTFEDMEDRLREIDNVQARLKALTPPEAIKEKHFIEQKMRQLDEGRFNYYKSMVLQLREGKLEGWTVDDLRAELDEDRNVSKKTRETIEVWLRPEED